jgi:hypothetical protein
MGAVTAEGSGVHPPQDTPWGRAARRQWWLKGCGDAG